jgi:hypothetical protein
MFSGVNRSCRGLAAVLMAGVLTTTVAACGGDGSTDAGDSGMTVGDLHTEVAVDVTGAVTLKGSSRAPMATNNGVDYQSCDQYGGGEQDDEGQKYFVLPQMPIDSIDGKRVYVGAMIKDYHGAGSYEKGTLTDTGSPPGVSFDGTLYYTQQDSTSQITTDGEGGGSWVFTGLSVKNPDGTEGGGPQVSGSVTWSCAE